EAPDGRLVERLDPLGDRADGQPRGARGAGPSGRRPRRGGGGGGSPRGGRPPRGGGGRGRDATRAATPPPPRGTPSTSTGGLTRLVTTSASNLPASTRSRNRRCRPATSLPVREGKHTEPCALVKCLADRVLDHPWHTSGPRVACADPSTPVQPWARRCGGGRTQGGRLLVVTAYILIQTE